MLRNWEVAAGQKIALYERIYITDGDASKLQADA